MGARHVGLEELEEDHMQVTPTPSLTKVFEEQWITAPTRALGPRFRRNATGPDGTPSPEPKPES